MTEHPRAAGLPSLAVCQSVLENVDMAGDLDLLVETGTDSFAVLGALLRKTGVDETRELMTARGLAASSYHAGMRILEMDDSTADQTLRDGLSTAAALGAPILMTGTGPAGLRSPAAADDVVVERLGRVAPLAADLGIVMAIEPVHPFLRGAGYVHTLGHAAELARRTPQVAVALDVVHVSWDRDFFADVERCADVVCTVHVSDFDAIAMQERRWGRAVAGAEIAPVGAAIRALARAGFRGSYEDETLLPWVDRATCIANIRASRQWFDRLWQA